MSKLVAGSLIVVAAMAGIYAVAASTATNIAASFAPAVASPPASIGPFAADVRQAAAEFRAARAKCEHLAGTKKGSCMAKARSEDRRAAASARQL